MSCKKALLFLSYSKVSVSFPSWRTQFIIFSVKTLTVVTSIRTVSSVALRLAHKQALTQLALW